MLVRKYNFLTMAKIMLFLNKLSTKNQAFSVIELSFIVTIFAMALVIYLAVNINPLLNHYHNQHLTEDRLNKIEEAILQFIIIHNRLPCPADCNIAINASKNTTYDSTNYSILADDENKVNTNFSSNSYLNGDECLTSLGGVPTRVLGLNIDYSLDGWGRKFLYHVSDNLCGNNSKTIKNCSAFSYNNNEGDLVITSKLSDNLIYTNSGAYVLLSFGGNGIGAYLPSGTQKRLRTVINGDEYENLDGDINYVKTNFSKNFDDIIRYKTKNQLNALIANPSISNTIITNSSLITQAACDNNSQTLAAINFNNSKTANNSTKNIREALTELEKKDININTGCDSTRINTYNCADEAVLEMLWILQEVCSYYFPTMIKLCPGGGNFDVNTNSCLCANRSWSGNC